MVSAGFSYPEETNPLVGRWEWTRVYPEGPLSILAVFRSNGTYDGFANKKSFVSGTYSVKHDTLFISDPVCNSKYSGTYKLTFLGQRDSVRFNVIQDTCKGRRGGVNGMVYKQVKVTAN